MITLIAASKINYFVIYYNFRHTFVPYFQTKVGSIYTHPSQPDLFVSLFSQPLHVAFTRMNINNKIYFSTAP